MHRDHAVVEAQGPVVPSSREVARGSLRGVLLLTLVLAGCNPEAQGGAAAPGAEAPLPDCEWCGAAEAPEALSWQTTLAGPDEPGEPLVISGTVYQPDGRTPAPELLQEEDRGVIRLTRDERGRWTGRRDIVLKR